MYEVLVGRWYQLPLKMQKVDGHLPTVKPVMVSLIGRWCSVTKSLYDSTKLSFLLLIAWWLEVELHNQ